jgi:hypothetical protein
MLENFFLNCLIQKSRCILDAFVGGVGSFSGILLYQFNLGIVLHGKEGLFTLTAKLDWGLLIPLSTYTVPKMRNNYSQKLN